MAEQRKVPADDSMAVVEDKQMADSVVAAVVVAAQLTWVFDLVCQSPFDEVDHHFDSHC